MKKTVKKGKSILACVMALAVLAISLFTGMVVTADVACDGKIDMFTGDQKAIELLDKSKPNSESNPYIISSANQMYNFMVGNSTVDGVQIDSTDKYFKVADGIKAFVMNGGENVLNLKTPAEVKAYFEANPGKQVWAMSDKAFKGHFDGNGVTIYGIYSQPNGTAGLFPYIGGNATIKNVAVKNSHLVGTQGAGGFVGSSYGTDAKSITLENCVSANNYIECGRGDSGAGALVGYLYNATNGTTPTTLNNCLVYGNELVSTKGQLCSAIGGSFNAGKNSFNNSVFLGCAPTLPTASFHTNHNSKYSNCYTDQTPTPWDGAPFNDNQLKQITSTTGSAAKAAMPNLDWANTWFENKDGIPELRAFHKDIKVVDNGDGTHSEACECGLQTNASAHVFIDGVCACGKKASCGEVVSVYTGTPDATLAGAGTADNPYLVKTADEFAAVALGKIASTENTYFKVVGVDAFYINGGEAVANMTNVNDVKSYFVTNAATVNNWKSTGPFMGNFDGNGVTVYGVYANHTGQYDYAGLFPKVDGHSSIKNIAIKNSYFSSYSKDGAIGSLVGGTIWKGDSNTNTSVTIENVVSANNYLASTNSGVQQGASVLMGRFFEKHYATINNCIMYGNLVENAYTGVDVKSGMITEYNGTYENTVFNNIIAIGVTPWTIVDKGDGTYGASGWYLSVLDTGHFKNIYTDQSTDKLQAFQPAKNSAEILEKYNINSIAATDMVGEDAVKNITSLDGNWIYSAQSYPELRVFHDDELKVEYAADNYAGHIESCSCGLVSPVVAHDYNENSKCIECEFTCDHANADVNIVGGDCLTAATKTVKCSCGYEESSLTGNAAGHTFTNVAEIPSKDCKTQGTAAHKYCSVCDKKYATDADVMAAYDTALSDEALKLPVAAHKAAADDSGIIYNANDATHSKICSVCQEKFDTENHVGTFIADGANGHKGQCSVCKIGTSDEAVPHNFVGSTCEDCSWTCTAHNFVEGDVKNEGDCTNNHVVATYCSICKIAGSDKVTAAPGHTNGAVQTENVVAPDCDTDGSHDEVIYCTVCETELSRTAVTDNKLGHTEGEIKSENVVEPDCETDGSHDEVVYCTVCEEELSRENVTDNKLGHKLTKVEEIEATYDSVGTKSYFVCECGEKFADAKATTKVTDEELVIDKLVKEEEDSSENDTEEKPEVKPEGDASDKSPATKDDVISVVAFAALIGAAFIATKKFRNK